MLKLLLNTDFNTKFVIAKFKELREINGKIIFQYKICYSKIQWGTPQNRTNQISIQNLL